MREGRLNPAPLGVVDVGTNSVRLMVVRPLSDEAFEVVDEERFDVRLGAGGPDRPIDESAQGRLCEALLTSQQIAAAYGIEHLHVAGTEALRRAPNAAAVLARIRTDYAIDVRVLTPMEEAYASFVGVANSNAARDAAIVDLGGGSLEVIRMAGRSFVGAISVPLGSLYATSAYLRGDPPPPKELRALRRAVRRELRDVEPAATAIGVGGSIRNLARLARRNEDSRRLHGMVVPAQRLSRLASQLAGMTTEARRRMPGLGAQRADSLHAAAVVTDEALKTIGATSLIVSGQGLREGLIWQAMRGKRPLLDDVRAASIRGLMRSNGVEASRSEPVVEVLRTLVAAVSGQSGLPTAVLEILAPAARLAGIGMHIDYYSRDRHAEYLVRSGDLHGFTHDEVAVLAGLVRYADAGEPSSAPPGPWTSRDPRRLGAMATLLGLARAVNRRSPSAVNAVDAAIEQGQLVVTLHGAGPLDAERLALQRQGRRVQTQLGLRLVVRAVSAPGRGGRPAAGTTRATPHPGPRARTGRGRLRPS
jgi:exopolyphosphatase/guanosine-5'-triphosphate,3'-diphosphate pyrophosphatase